jgi:LmbE family N-acetylglucosaminyl deacetylase
MNILVIAPHPDDEAIGCGGTILLHKERSDNVAVVFLTSGELGLKNLPKEEVWSIREGEAEEASGILGIDSIDFLRQPDWFLGDNIAQAAGALQPVIVREKPDRIYLPHPREWHPDHAASLPISLQATALSGQRMPELFGYEIWTPLGEYDHVEDTGNVIDRKLDAVRCYRSQLQGFRYDRAVLGLNQYRGALAARCDYAEVFASLAPGP